MYRAVGSLCAVDFGDFDLPISSIKARSILIEIGFEEVNNSLTESARSVIGSKYRKGAKLTEAPEFFNCSSLPKWLYGQIGIWIPRWCIQQYMFGTNVDLGEVRPGDLVFTEGFTPLHVVDPAEGVSHVAMVLDSNTVIHAASRRIGVGVFTSSLSTLTDTDNLRGIRRIVPELEKIVTLRIPPHQEVESSDDLKWIIYQNLP